MSRSLSSNTLKITPQYIGLPLTINAVRSFILAHQLTKADTVLLHHTNFDELALEYRETYYAHLPEPYFLLGVLVEAATDEPVPRNRVAVVWEDDRPHRLSLDQALANPDDGRIIYRCGCCGSFTTEAGQPVSEATRAFHIDLLRLRGSRDNVRHVDGNCCTGQRS